MVRLGERWEQMLVRGTKARDANALTCDGRMQTVL